MVTHVRERTPPPSSTNKKEKLPSSTDRSNVLIGAMRRRKQCGACESDIKSRRGGGCIKYVLNFCPLEYFAN